MTTAADILESSSLRLLEAGRVYLGIQAGQIEALGSAFLARGQAHPAIEREFAYVSAALALDPEVFYEVAWMVSGRVASAAQTALREIQRLFSGPGEILRWSRASVGASTLDPEELIRLQMTVRRARFARNNATEQVNTEVLSKARIAQEALLAYQRREVSSTLLSPAQLNQIVETVLTVEERVSEFVSLPDDYQQVDWREQALLRLLDAFDADLSSSITAFQTELLSDAPLTDALVEVTAAIGAMEILLTQAYPFGQLLSPQVRLVPNEPTFETQVLLRPRPSAFLGGRSFPCDVVVESGDLFMRTCTPEAGEDSAPSWFEHAFQLAKTERSYLAICETAPVHDVLADVLNAELFDYYAADTRSAWLAEMSVIDYTASVNYSSNAAGSGGFLVREGSYPAVGDYVRLGDVGEPRLYVGAVGAPLELLGAGNGRWALVLVSDPAGDTPSGVVTYLNGLVSEGGFVAVTQLGNTAAIDLRLAVSSLSTQDFDELQLLVELDAPYDTSYPSLSTGGVFDALFVDDSTHPTFVGVAWTHSVYKPSSRGWTARAVLFNNSTTQGQTRTLRALARGGVDELRRRLTGQSVVLIDPAGVEDDALVKVERVSVQLTDALDSANTFPQQDDVLLHLSALVPTADWVLCLPLPGVYEASPVSWRGRTASTPDVAAGDTIISSSGAPHLVLSTAGNLVRLHADLPASDSAEVRRFRHVRAGDDVVAWDGEIARAGKVEAVVWGGVRISGVPAGAYGSAAFHREGTTVRTAEVVSSEGNVLDMESYNFTEAWRQYAAPYAVGDALEDARVDWTFRVHGRAQTGVVLSRSLVEMRSLLFPLGEGLIPCTLVARVRARGLDATLHHQELWDDGTGEGLGEVSAGGAFILDLVSKSRAQLRSTTLPAEVTSLGVSTLHTLTRAYSGPLYQGGSPSYGGWALSQYRFERAGILDLEELRADLGRARSLLGADRKIVASGALTLDSSLSGGTLTLDPGWSAVAVRGLEILDGGATPLRIREAEDLGSGAFSVRFTRASSSSGALNLYDSAIGQAFREAYRVRQRLQSYITWCSYLSRTTAVMTSASQRLRAEGLDRAADVVQRGDFAALLQTDALSNWGGGLMDRARDLMQTLLSAREAPADS